MSRPATRLNTAPIQAWRATHPASGRVGRCMRPVGSGYTAAMSSARDGRRDPRVTAAQPADRGTRTTRAIGRATAAAGSFPAILVSVALTAVWLAGGLFVKGGYANPAYQLPVSTVSSIVTFVMVFVIQSSQNRDSRALQAKVDAIANTLAVLAREQGIRDQGEHLLTRFVGLEDAPEDEIDREQARVRRIADWTAHRLAHTDDVSVEPAAARVSGDADGRDATVPSGADGRPGPDSLACHGPG